MTRDERGRCVQVPVSLAGLIGLWCVAGWLIVWDLAGGPQVGQLGLFTSAGAAAWTVIYGLARQQDLLRNAFELGRDAERASVHRLADR